MAEKLKIIPLGGLNEIGKNMTVLEYGKDIIIVDCGLGFPDDEMYGVDLVIADMTYLVKNKDRIRGMFLTHGHEDHIGGIPYAMEQFRCPIHATRLTAGIVQLKLEEHQLQNAVHLFTHEAGEKVKAGCFTVEFIHVNHSIADAVAFAIKTPVGTVVMTGDFKIDATAEDGMIDLARFGALGKEGVLALLCDSTNVERQGYTPSERTVAGSFERQFTGCNKRIIVTTFASNVHRLQQIINVFNEGVTDVGNATLVQNIAEATFLGEAGPIIISIFLLLFAFTSLIGYYTMSESNIRFIKDSKGFVFAVRVLVIAVAFLSCVISTGQMETICDTFMAAMGAVNMIVVFYLSKFVFRAYKDWREQEDAGVEDPVFHRDVVKDLCNDKTNITEWE